MIAFPGCGTHHRVAQSTNDGHRPAGNVIPLRRSKRLRRRTNRSEVVGPLPPFAVFVMLRRSFTETVVHPRRSDRCLATELMGTFRSLAAGAQSSFSYAAIPT